MNGRFVAALGLMMAAAGFSGCLEAMQFLGNEDGEVTAKENRDLADSAARAWSPDAELMAVFAFENPNMTDEFPSDPTPGNGRAPVWLYAYSAQNGTENRAFQVSAGGQVRILNDSMMGAPDVGEPITAWEIDSDQAVETARANATFESVAGQEGAVVMEALGAEEGTTVWAIMAGTAGGQAIAVVSALDGTLIFAEAFQMDFDLPPMPIWGMEGASMRAPQVVIEDANSVSADILSGERVEYAFNVTHADVATLHLMYEPTLPTDGIRWSVVDASGEIIEDGYEWSYNGMSGMAMSEFALETPGPYVLVVEYATMTWAPVPPGSVDYELMFVVGPMPEDMVDEDVGTTCC